MAEKEHWHLDKRISVGHLFTTVAAVSVMVSWAINMESRITEHDVKIANNSEKVERVEERANKSFERVYELVSKVNDKLDRLIERR